MKPPVEVTRDDRLLVVGGAPRPAAPAEPAPLDLDALAVAGIAAADDLVDEAAVGGEVVEVARAAQQQRVLDRLLEMAVRALDRAVLVRDAGIVAGRRHAVVGAQRLVAPRQVLRASRSRLRNAADRLSLRCSRGHAAERPQRVLQALGQRDKLSPPSTTWACSKPEKASRK